MRLSLLVLVPFAHAAEFHVAPTGSDAAGDGSQGKPFFSVPRARDAARATPGPHTLLLAPGRYFNEAPVVLDDRDSGLHIVGEKPGAVAEIYGGMPVTGWENWQGGIWRAPVPKGKRFLNLIVDGRIATMARSPNAGSGYGLPQTGAKWDFADAQMFTWLGVDWFSDNLLELRLDSPRGELIGTLPVGATECPAKPVTGVHNLYLVFPGKAVETVDWFKFE